VIIEGIMVDLMCAPKDLYLLPVGHPVTFCIRIPVRASVRAKKLESAGLRASPTFGVNCTLFVCAGKVWFESLVTQHLAALVIRTSRSFSQRFCAYQNSA
jgi:hypothetical protein